MSVRLAFSVAIQVDADVLLVDEVLAVGDAAFQQKCFEQFHRLKDEGKTIVFVTHDMSAVERFCDRAMLIERGQGRCRSASRTRSRAPTTSSTSAAWRHDGVDGDRYGDHAAAEIKDAWFEDVDGERVTAHRRRASRCRMCMEVALPRRRSSDPIVRCWRCATRSRHTIFATSTDLHDGRDRARFEAGETVARRASALENWLAPGRYDLTPTVARAGAAAPTRSTCARTSRR